MKSRILGLLRRFWSRLRPQASHVTFTTWAEAPVPPEIAPYFVSVYMGLRKLAARGFAPDFIIDVGASTGCWSDMAFRVFPRARYVLVEPLAARYRALYPGFLSMRPEFELVEAAAAAEPGRVSINASHDLFSSSVFWIPSAQDAGPVDVPATTLDAIARERGITGRGLLKMDIQFAEHLALRGARELMANVDIVILEIALLRCYPDAPVFIEVLQAMAELGFRYHDDVGEYRMPHDGTLSHKDGLFVREGQFLPW